METLKESNQRLMLNDAKRVLHTIRDAPMAWVVIAISMEQWALYYPALSFHDDPTAPILIFSKWERLATPQSDLTHVGMSLIDSRGRSLVCWCVVQPSALGWKRKTSFSVGAVGNALPPTEEDGGLIVTISETNHLPLAGWALDW